MTLCHALRWGSEDTTSPKHAPSHLIAGDSPLHLCVVVVAQTSYLNTLLAFHELHGYGVHAVPGVLWGKAFTEEYVSQMSSAVVALNLDSMAVGVG